MYTCYIDISYTNNTSNTRVFIVVNHRHNNSDITIDMYVNNIDTYIYVCNVMLYTVNMSRMSGGEFIVNIITISV